MLQQLVIANAFVGLTNILGDIKLPNMVDLKKGQIATNRKVAK